MNWFHYFLLVNYQLVLSVGAQFIFREDPLALLSGTLRTIQRAACDGETLTLRCPLGTAVSIQLAQYGRPAPGINLCPAVQQQPTDDIPLVVAHSNDTCALTPQMQHALLQTVVEACMKKRHCKFLTSPKNSEISPCSNQPKFVEVAYKCRPLEFRSKIICENETINLKCKRNARIAIYSATFGRTHYQSLQCPQSPGVPEETCESSFSTETVMQVCHGKRRCSLVASSSTFGNPCSPHSHLYLRVVYTCVSRRILKDHYQGELEEDESENALDEEENSFESEDYAEAVAVATAATPVPVPRHVADSDFMTKNYRTTIRPDSTTGVFGGFFENQEKFILYLTLSIAAGILVLLSLLIGRLWWQKRRAASENKLQSVDPIPAFTDDLSDVDNDIDLTIIPPPSLMTELTSLGPASSASSSDALRYNTARNGTIRRQDESDNHPRSFMRNGNNHYYYG